MACCGVVCVCCRNFGSILDLQTLLNFAVLQIPRNLKILIFRNVTSCLFHVCQLLELLASLASPIINLLRKPVPHSSLNSLPSFRLSCPGVFFAIINDIAPASSPPSPSNHALAPLSLPPCTAPLATSYVVMLTCSSTNTRSSHHSYTLRHQH